MRIIVIFFLSLIVYKTNAQTIKKADFLYSKGYYEEAIQIYETKLKKKKKATIKNHIHKQLTYCYSELHNEEKAFYNFDKIEKSSLSNKDAYTGFQLLRSLKKYDEADQLLKNHDSLKNNQILIDISKWSIEKINETNGSYNLFLTNLETNGHSFGYSTYENSILFSSLIHDKNSANEGQTFFYDLYQYPMLNDSTFDLKKSKKIIEDNRRVFYRGTPYITNNEKTIYYTTNSSEAFKYNKLNTEKKSVSNEGENILKIFEYDTELKTHTSLPINNNNYHNCFPHLYNDTVIFYSSSKEGSQTMLDIYYITKHNKEWSLPKKVQNINTFEDEVYPFVYNNKFYFSSRGREGFGGMDIYSGDISYNEDGQIEILNIKNLLQPINSSKDDFAYLQNSENGGYISSNRNSKKGEDKIYYFSKSLGDTIEGIVIDAITKEKITTVNYQIFEKKNGKWRLINEEKLGDPAEFNSIIDPNKNYKISFESEGYYGEEVQIPNSSFEELRNEIKEFIKIIELEPINQTPLVYDILTNLPIKGAEIQIRDKNGNLLSKKESNEKGNWEFDFDNQDIEIEVLKEGYDNLTIDLSDWNNPKSRNYKKSGMTPKHNAGDKMTINNIYFEFDSSKIRPESYKILNNIVKFMNRYPDVKFELGAHTDCVGPNEYNEKLSTRRANSCWKYLISAGINKNRMKPKGYGERVPLHPCSEQRKNDKKALLNRRIEMTIL